MPRDGSQQYHVPPGTLAITNYTVESTKYNAFTADLEQDLNLPRPIVAGGTGASDAATAMNNLGGELARQVIANYNSDPFQAGSFYSAAGATSAPTANAFTGICYVSDAPTNSNMFIEARDQVTSQLWVRQKKAGVWQSWINGTAVLTASTPPASPAANTLWWDPTRGKLFIYYDDGDSKQWVEAVAIPNLDPNAYLKLTGGTMTGPIINPSKSNQFGANTGAVATGAVAQGDANILLYNAAPTNWAGFGADPGGQMWFRTGASGTPAPAMYIDTAQVVHFAHPPVGLPAALVLRSYLAGLTLSTSGPSTTFSVAPGMAADSSNTVMMMLGAALAKTTGAWAVGNGAGALDIGSIAASTWYHVYLIQRPDTGIVDVLLSLNSATPTLPPNYTLFRRLGSVLTNASSQWILFTQLGDEFLWLTPVPDFSSTNIPLAGALYTLTVPPGVQVMAKFWVDVNFASTFVGVLFYSPDITTTAAGGRMNAGTGALGTTSSRSMAELSVRTNTSAQVRGASNTNVASVSGNTFGWTDRRGRDA